MPKKIIYNQEAREKLKAGINKVANAVKVTLGARGRNVILGRGYGLPVITKDGVSVAREIELEDAFENIGAQLIKEVSLKTNDEAGDGTTTATILAQAMINEGFKYIVGGYDPLEIKRGMDKATQEAIEKLKDLSKPVKNNIEHIASISANDKSIGKIIADAMKEVGEKGIITVESGTTNDIEVEIVKGMKISKGMVTPYMMTNTAKAIGELTNPSVLITSNKITMPHEISIINKLIEDGKKDLLIIANDTSGEALSALIQLRISGGFNCIAVNAPSAGTGQMDVLQDIAELSGATIISNDIGIKMQDASLDMLGKLQKVVSTPDETTLVQSEDIDVSARVAYLQAKKESAVTQFEKEALDERIAKLSGGVAVIKVGASSEVEIKEIKDRVEDAINATKAAVEEGVVVGGGLALYKIQDTLEDTEIGVQIIKNALAAPIRQIITNAGDNEGIILAKIKEGEFKLGYNAQTGELVDLEKIGVLDPCKVTRCALLNANSIASTLLTTEAIVVEDKHKDG